MNATPGIEEFPDWVPPVLVRDARRRFRAGGFVGLYVAVHLFCFLALAGELGILALLDQGPVHSGVFLDVVFFFTFVLILPLREWNALQPECGVRGNSSLLVLATLGRWNVVLAKWSLAAGLSLVLVVSVIPYLILLALTGSGQPGEHLLRLLTFVATHGLLSAFVIAASGYSSYLVRFAIIVAFFVGFALTAGTLSEAGSGDYLAEAGAVSAGILYTLLALQLARSRLDTRERTVSPLPALVFLTGGGAPISIAVTFSVSGSFGSWLSWIALALLILLTLAFDRESSPARKTFPARTT